MPTKMTLGAEIDDYTKSMGEYSRVADVFNSQLSSAQSGQQQYAYNNGGAYYITKAGSDGLSLMSGSDLANAGWVEARKGHYYGASPEGALGMYSISGNTLTNYRGQSVPIMNSAPDPSNYGSAPEFTNAEVRTLEGEKTAAQFAKAEKSVAEKTFNKEKWSPLADNDMGLVARALAGKL